MLEFILGIFTGWLVEWLFYTFYWKNRKSADKSNKVAASDATNSDEAKPEKKSDPAPEKQEGKSPVQEKVEDIKEEVTDKVEDVKEAIAEKVEEVKEDVAEVVEEVKEEVVEKVKDVVDDLTKLVGIGPKVAEKMNAMGIKRYQQLADTNMDDVIERLGAEGVRIPKAASQTWSRQGSLAAKGDWDGIETIKADLKK
jgi:predicted flap endonuclease-1-like 5' DNA nuclease